MLELFSRLSQDPEATRAFQQSKMLVQFQFSDPALEAWVDGKHNPIAVSMGPQAARPDLALRMPADVLHDVWLGRTRLRDAFFSGQIKVSGNMFRALKLEDLFRRAEALYPVVLEDQGYQI
jgi:putative sterol carrier protein